MKEFDTKYVYRVWYDAGKEAFFTDKNSAKDFAQLVNGYMNVWTWEMQIEK